MEWLTIWLKKIILLVLLAAFLDLILPNTNMQRYVRMVMGLILLVTMISPIFSLFNLSQDEVAFRLHRYQEAISKPPEEEWKRLTEKLLGQRDQQVTNYVHEQIEQTIRAQVQKEYAVELSDVEVKLVVDDVEKPEIKAITLLVGESDQQQNASIQVQPIRPVQIVIGNQSDQGQADKEVAAAANDNPLFNQIAQSVAREWNLSPKQVSVTNEKTQAY